MDWECSICIESNKEDLCNVFKCNHTFHKKCISKWNGNCPTCRSSKKSLISFHSELNINNYLIFKEARNCHNNLHRLYAFQAKTPPYGAIVNCRNCNKSYFYPMIF